MWTGLTSGALGFLLVAELFFRGGSCGLATFSALLFTSLALALASNCPVFRLLEVDVFARGALALDFAFGAFLTPRPLVAFLGGGQGVGAGMELRTSVWSS